MAMASGVFSECGVVSKRLGPYKCNPWLCESDRPIEGTNYAAENICVF
jgi:hypothetical protein